MSTAPNFKHPQPFPFCVNDSKPTENDRLWIGPITLAEAMELYWKTEKVTVAATFEATFGEGAGEETVSRNIEYDFVAINQPADRVCYDNYTIGAYIHEETVVDECDIQLTWPDGTLLDSDNVVAFIDPDYYFAIKAASGAYGGIIGDSFAYFFTFTDFGASVGGYEKIATGSLNFFPSGSDIDLPYYIYGYTLGGAWTVSSHSLSLSPVNYTFPAPP